MSNKARRARKSKAQRRKAVKKREEMPALAILLGLATLIGALAAIVTFFPRLTPSVSDPSDPNDPFSSSVTITNSGYMPLNSVDATVCLNELHLREPQKDPTYGAYGGDSNSPSYARFGSKNWKTHYLGLDDRFTFLLNDAFAPGFGEGSLALIVDYEIPVIHLKREKVFPLLSKKRNNGTFYWAFDTQSN